MVTKPGYQMKISHRNTVWKEVFLFSFFFFLFSFFFFLLSSFFFLFSFFFFLLSSFFFLFSFFFGIYVEVFYGLFLVGEGVEMLVEMQEKHVLFLDFSVFDEGFLFFSFLCFFVSFCFLFFKGSVRFSPISIILIFIFLLGITSIIVFVFVFVFVFVLIKGGLFWM